MNSKTSSITTLLFDWDGTVVNSAKPGLQAFEQSFAELGVYFDHEIYQAVYSPNWYSVYEAMGLPKEKWQMADDLWVQYYGEQTAEPLPGAQQTISELNGKGYRLGVVSSGNERRVTRELNQLGLASFFETLVCHEHMQNKKPHPEGLETAMRLLACTSEVVCYVGDSPEDIQMGKRAKVFTVGVRSDYPTSWKLQSHGPDILIDSLSELLSHF
ncbi:MAG TPA: HAD-IA family hydrolase [Pyrinomonadaceae bacterium]|nr:HAD-IA family hydrolase [Pyrinomonadaceae bacterium]